RRRVPARRPGPCRRLPRHRPDRGLLREPQDLPAVAAREPAHQPMIGAGENIRGEGGGTSDANRLLPATSRAKGKASRKTSGAEPARPGKTVMPDNEVTGATALVTGASRGFGRGIAAALSKAGAQVVGVARDRAPLEELRAQLGGSFT